MTKTQPVPNITIDQLCAGDSSAWAHLYDWLARDLRSFIRRIGGNDPDDLLSETMLNLVRDISTFTGHVSDIRPWAFRIARNRVIDAARKQHVRPQEVPLQQFDEPIVIDVTPSGELDLGSLGLAFGQLTAEQREVLWLRYALDVSLDDTASILESTPEAVASMAYRALSRLRKSTSTLDN